MANIVFFDLSFYAVFLLITLLVVIYIKHELYTLKGRLFRYLIIATLTMLLLEVFSWAFDSYLGGSQYYLNWLFNSLFTGFGTVVPSLWAIYISYMIFNDTKRLKVSAIVYGVPILILILLTIINFIVPILFTIDKATNTYSRLPGIWTGTVVSYLTYLYVLVLVLHERRRIESNILVGVMIFLFLPLIAAVLQLLNYGLLLIWPVTAVSLIFSYLLFETTSSSVDFLTKLYTRSRAEDYIKSLIDRNKKFVVMMMDMDDFKEINDNYGHHIGDQVLVDMGRTLRQVFTKKDIVSRFGGDEFFIVTENIKDFDIEEIRTKITSYLQQSKNEYVKTARFSIGYSVCNNLKSDCNVDSIMIAADNKMYRDKAENKNFKRRKDDL